MKKRIVYFLCEIGLIKIAEKISVSIVYCWKGEKIAQGFIKGIESLSNWCKTTTISIQKLTEALNEHETNK